jgi:hypothetical protein
MKGLSVILIAHNEEQAIAANQSKRPHLINPSVLPIVMTFGAGGSFGLANLCPARRRGD